MIRYILIALMMVTIGCAQTPTEPSKYIPTQIEVEAENITDVPFGVYCTCAKGSTVFDKHTCEVNLAAMKNMPVGLASSYEEYCFKHD